MSAVLCELQRAAPRDLKANEMGFVVVGVAGVVGSTCDAGVSAVAADSSIDCSGTSRVAAGGEVIR